MYMATLQPEQKLENDRIQRGVSEVVNAALETPLREPIVDAVEEKTELHEPRTPMGEEMGEGESENSRFIQLIQGATGFAVVFVLLYAALRALETGSEDR